MGSRAHDGSSGRDTRIFTEVARHIVPGNAVASDREMLTGQFNGYGIATVEKVTAAALEGRTSENHFFQG